MPKIQAVGSRIQTETDLLEFFRQQVETVAGSRKAPVSKETVYYISGLLADQGHTEESNAPDTLVELQVAATSEPSPAQAVTLWRKLGDRALLLSGFFHEHLDYRRISRNYYEQMGSIAYARLCGMLGGPASGFGQIFEELSRGFQQCAELICEVKHEVKPCNDTDVIRLYEEFLKTGSPRVAERLKKLGVMPQRLMVEV
jgi:hypothetical protein